MIDLGLLMVRTAVGVALVAQGRSKAGAQRESTAAYLRQLGFEPAPFLAALTAAVEIGAGVLLVAGFATPLAAAAALGVLVNASVVNAANGWAASRGGAEYPVTLGVIATGLVLCGAGSLSIDATVGLDRVEPFVAVGAIGVAALTALPILVTRQRRLRGTTVHRLAA